jgi:hypothetical protein
MIAKITAIGTLLDKETQKDYIWKLSVRFNRRRFELAMDQEQKIQPNSFWRLKVSSRKASQP